MGYSFRLAARDLLYAPSHKQDSTYHGLDYTSRGALAGMKIVFFKGITRGLAPSNFCDIYITKYLILFEESDEQNVSKHFKF